MTQPILLIVDDDPIVRASLGALLIGEGYQLYFAVDGLEGVQKAIELHPDVILLDVMMPAVDGYEVCHRLRSEPSLQEIPILFLTALDDRDSRLRGLEAGADDFLSKPIDRLELRARLRTITRLDRYRKLNQERLKIVQTLGELQCAYDETIEGWSRAMDLRDKETEGHSRRVTEMTLSIARTFGIDNEEELVNIRRGALLHDVGKLGIPDAILLKPAALSDKEMEIMRKHPTYAYEMLSPIAYLRASLVIPYCHHEKWDGSGYPRGLRGEEIPLAARLFSVSDIWDALLSDRPYRAKWPKEKAYQYIQTLAGTHLDQQIVTVFKEIIVWDDRRFDHEIHGG
jgi:putative two-component system response regulator